MALLFLEPSHGGPSDHHPLSNEQVMEAYLGRQGGEICVSNAAHMAGDQMRGEQDESKQEER